MAEQPGTAAVAEQPADFSLAKYRAEKQAPVEPIAKVEAPAVAPAVPDDEPDPELAKEIDAVAPPAKDETPQQKAARTKDYRERARKGMVSRIANERDAARAEVARLKALVDSSQRSSAAPAGATPAASSPASPASVPLDPNDPEPTYDSFLKAHPDHPDPYAGFLREQGKWDRRQEARQAEQQSRAASATSAVEQAQRQYHQRVETVRTAHPNYYDVVDPFVQAAKDHPLSPFITEAILGSERGPELLYRIASDRDLAKAVYMQPSPTLALKQLGIIEAALPNATPATPATPAAVTLPPEPVTPVGGSALPNTGDPTTSLAAWRKHKQAAGWRR